MKFSIDCLGYRPFPKNTLVGFVDIRIRELRIVIKDIALHQRGESRWVQLPARPQLRDGVHIPDP